MHTYTKSNTDWVGLQFFQDFFSGKNTIEFLSIPIAGINFTFSFDHKNPCIHQRIRESLMHNATLSDHAHDYHESIAWDCDGHSHHTGSMIFNQNFVTKTHSLVSLNLKYIIDQMIHDWHYIYMKHVAHEYDMACLIKDHPYFYGIVERKRQNY